MRTADDNSFGLTPLEDRLLLSATLLNAGATAMIYDTAGALHVAYYDTAAHTLMYTARSPAGAWDPAITLDATPYSGAELSIALDSTGRPAVAYYDGTNRDLKFAQKTRRGWTVQTLDSAGTVGHAPSLAFTPDGFPLISYYAASTADLRLASFNGTRWYVTTVDATGSVGRFSDLVISPLDGSWAIAYESQSDHTIRYAQKWGKSFTTRVIDTLNGDANWLAKPSLAFNSTGNPLVSYVDGDDLILNRAGRKTWSHSTIVEGGVTSPNTTLLLQSDAPRLLYAQAGAFSIASTSPDGTWPTGDLLASAPLAVANLGDRINLLTAGGTVTSVDPTAPLPLGLAAERSGGWIHLTWSAAPAYAQQLTLERRPANGSDFQKLADLSALDREYWDADLTPGQTYVYRLRVSAGIATDPFASTTTLSFTVPAPTLTLAAQYLNEVDLSWANVPADANLVIERAAAGSDDFQSLGTFYPGTTSFTDFAPLGTNYVYRARAVVTDALVSAWVILPVDTVLPTPDLALHVDEAAADHVTLSWTGLPAGPLTVYIDRAQVGQPDFSLVATGTSYGDVTSATWSDYDVTDGLAYVYRIRLVGEHGISLPTDAATARANLPPFIGGTMYPTNGPAGVILHLFGGTHALGYRIERSDDNGAHYQTLAELAQPDENGQYVDLTAAEQAYYVYAVTAIGQYANSQTVCDGIWTAYRLPTDLTAQVVSPSQVHLTWTDNSNYEGYFNLLISTDGTTFTPWGSYLPANTTQLNVDHLTPGQTYWFEIRSFNRSSFDGYVDPVVRIDLPLSLPGIAPAYLRATTGSTTAHLTWSDQTADETGWRIERSDDGGNTFNTLADLPAASQSYDDAALLPSYTYIYRVYSTTGDQSGAIATVTATTYPANPPAPAAPVLIGGIALFRDLIKLTWDALPPDVQSLDVAYRSPVDGQVHTLASGIDPSLTSARIGALDNGQPFAGLTYTMWLVADGPGGSTAGNAITIDTSTGSLGLTATVIRATTVQLTWADAYDNYSANYELWLSTDGVTYRRDLITTYTTLTFSGMQADTTYWFKLRVIDPNAGNTSFTDPVSVYVPPAP